ncbi:MAG: dihydrolipoamide dehydrogenase [Hyphomicrobiaceae bacterium]|jgi:dihydrolipoamide dehydrogenase
MTDIKCKLLVIGAGPGGYVCAIRAGQLGIDTIVVEAERMGGTCLNVGCIPSKALIHAADEFYKLRMFADKAPLGISAKDPSIDVTQTRQWMAGIVGRLNQGVGGLLKKAGVRSVAGVARFLDGKTVAVETGDDEQRIRAETIVIATGSAPIELPALPFGGDILSSTEALELTEIPGRLAVVGGGYIGLEIGTAYAKLGSEVTVVEAADRILPQYDLALTAPIEKRLTALGVRIKASAKATSFSDGSLGVEDGASVAADKVLVAVGRRPRTRRVGLEELGLTMDRDFITIDEQCRTSMRGVFAIGDVTGEPMLAHRAMAQGEMVAGIIAGENLAWDKAAIPAVCFTDPEIITVGLSPDEAETAGHDIQVGQFPFQANGRAMTTEREDGFVRVVARKDNGVLLGIQAVGEGVSELSATFSLALEMGARLEDIAATIHAHPTRSEAFQEAALKSLGHALHI